jgi:5'-phosphate synthase pdxT subunit
MKIGVLALQGAFIEHVRTLRAIGVEPVEVRLPGDLEGVAGLIIPGGESTTMRKLIDRWGLRRPILELAASGAPIFGTCAGMIVLAREIAGGEEPVLPLLDVRVERNAFGRQLDSFEADLAVPVLGDQPVHAIFIRAPIIERTSSAVDVLAQLADGRIVAVRERNIVATSFHPELAGETRFHRLVATMAAEHEQPGEGAGRRPHPTRRQVMQATTAERPGDRGDDRTGGRTDDVAGGRAHDRTDDPAGGRDDERSSDRADDGADDRADDR